MIRLLYFLWLVFRWPLATAAWVGFVIGVIELLEHRGFKAISVAAVTGVVIVVAAVTIIVVALCWVGIPALCAWLGTCWQEASHKGYLWSKRHNK